MEASLFLLGGSRDDRRIPLPETIFLIGRDRQCHLRPHCELVSKLHCAIAAWAGKVRVRDLRSRNGTYVNGQRIHGEVVVADGDQLRVGSVVFAFRIKTADGTPATAPLNPDDLRWLLEAPPDEVVLSPARQTRVRIDEPAGTEDLPADATIPALKKRTKIVSAGRHLHDYFEQHKRN
jgi:pSer/pThr/pTyr-binding forkhead associated (FHA) protein